MIWSWKLGRLAGIDVYLHPTLLLMILVFGTNGPGVLLLSAAFACVLLHEFGHALMARQFGIPTRDITLYPIGGVARLERMPRKPGPELAIALAGPAVNVAIALGLAAALILSGGQVFPREAPFGSFWIGLMLINGGLAVFNLIPAFPMDGGRVLRAMLAGWLGRLRATEIAAYTGQVLAVAFGIWSLPLLGHGSWMNTLLALFVYFAAGQELEAVRAQESRPDYDHSPYNPKTHGSPPSGFVWIRRPDGQWRLAPVVLTVPESRPWS
ncbi:MAG: site-2 protease family protein [Isosphaeraceae bacterium]